MIHILSWTTQKHQKTLSRPIHSKLKKIQGLFKDLHRNLRAFEGKMESTDFLRTTPKNSRTFQDCADPISANINNVNSGLNGLVSVSQGCMDPGKGLRGLHPHLQPPPLWKVSKFSGHPCLSNFHFRNKCRPSYLSLYFWSVQDWL